jgi:hypothetical protein
VKEGNIDFDIAEEFKKVELNNFPDFSNYDKPLEMGLWVLWVAKEKLNIQMLTAHHIANVIVRAMETSIKERAIVNSFNRAVGKIHIHEKDGETYYEIMKLGKEHLVTMAGEGSVKVFYFESGKKYTSKSILADKILSILKGELKIVDPYVDVKTLDVLSRADAKNVKFLTSLGKLSETNKRQFLRDLKDFKSEHHGIEFRNYSTSEIHDRYVIAGDKLIIFGHSLKDLGAKESFAITLDKSTASDIFDALVETFNRRWKTSSQL